MTAAAISPPGAVAAARRPLPLPAGFLCAAVLLTASAAWSQDSILPGYWETTDHLLGTSKVERRCILPRDIAKVMGGPSNHIYACAYPVDVIGGGRITFRGGCVDKKGRRFELSGGGTYTHTTLTMTAAVRGRLFGLPLSVTASTDAHRLGDVCPPGSPGSAPRGIQAPGDTNRGDTKRGGARP